MLTKRRLGLCLGMVRFDPADPFDDETPAADPLGAAPVAAPQAALAPARRAEYRADQPTVGTGVSVLGAAAERASRRRGLRRGVLRRRRPRPARPNLARKSAVRRRAAPAPGARAPPPPAPRWRAIARILPRCATPSIFRPTPAGTRPPARPGASIGCGAVSPRASAGFDQQNLRRAADLLELPRDLDLEALAGALRRLFQGEKNPLAAAARAGSTTTRMLDGAPRAETEILALWLSDLMLARKLGWDAPIALLATTIARPSSRSAGRRPRPGDADWPLHCATAVALAAREAHGLAADLSRRSAKLLSVAPKLRAKGASRVIEMLLADDAVSPATAAKAARLSDRASRRLFDRLVELGVARELSGRPSFRLYGL